MMVLTFIVICFYGLLNSFGIDRFLQALIINVLSILITFSLAGVFISAYTRLGELASNLSIVQRLELAENNDFRY